MIFQNNVRNSELLSNQRPSRPDAMRDALGKLTRASQQFVCARRWGDRAEELQDSECEDSAIKFFSVTTQSVLVPLHPFELFDRFGQGSTVRLVKEHAGLPFFYRFNRATRAKRNHRTAGSV